MSSLYLVEPRSHDLDTLMELVKSYHKYDGHDFDASLVRGSLEDLIKKPLLGRIWLIDLIDVNHAKNKNIGYIILAFGYSLEFHGRDAFIDEFFIVETMRGKGLGKKSHRISPAEGKNI